MPDTQVLSSIKPFMDENFLLETSVAEELYHTYAKEMPIIDYHCHLPPDQIAGDHQFDNLTRIWLDGDHYKWRAMRTSGVSEHFITGGATDYEKFEKWAETVPYTIRNPLFHWTHLELKRYFDVQTLLGPKTAADIYARCSEQLQSSALSTRNILRKMRVDTVCTTDDPADDLRYHKQIRDDGFEIAILPAFRPDKAILIDTGGFKEYIERLGNAADREIRDYTGLMEVLESRMAYFHANGCRLSDHGLNQVFAEPFSHAEMDRILNKGLSGEALTGEEVRVYQSGILYDLGRRYCDLGWVMQLHLGALRNNSARMARHLGPDMGFDSIGDFQQAVSLARFLDSLDEAGKLPKTILYNLNPADNAVMASMIGNFNDGSVRGKMQFGSAWWFLDQKDGIERQLNALSNMGLLSCFIGMLTDSRSFLSYPRHEYFRRILCNLIGADVHRGELPDDRPWLGKIVQDICFYNAEQYFEFPSK